MPRARRYMASRSSSCKSARIVRGRCRPTESRSRSRERKLLIGVESESESAVVVTDVDVLSVLVDVIEEGRADHQCVATLAKDDLILVGGHLDERHFRIVEVAFECLAPVGHGESKERTRVTLEDDDVRRLQ